MRLTRSKGLEVSVVVRVPEIDSRPFPDGERVDGVPAVWRALEHLGRPDGRCVMLPKGQRSGRSGPGIPPGSAVPVKMGPLRTFRMYPRPESAVKPTYFSNVNVLFSHPSEGKTQKDERKARSRDEGTSTALTTVDTEGAHPSLPTRPQSEPTTEMIKRRLRHGRPEPPSASGLVIPSGLGLLRRRR